MKSRNVPDDAPAAGLAASVWSGKYEKPKKTFLVILLIVGALVMIGVCILLAAVLAKYQKKGTFQYGDNDFELSHLVD